MENLTIEDKSVVFFNHGKLINEIYAVAEGNETYEIKEEMFHYLPKNLKAKQIIGHRNRKRKIKDIELDPETAKFKSWTVQAANTIKTFNLLVKADSQSKEISVASAFNGTSLNFKGANESTLFVNCSGNKVFGTNTNYIIPPFSRFFNYNISSTEVWNELSKQSFDLLVIDPPWRNKYVRRLMRSREDLGYKMLDNDQIRDLPLTKVIGLNTLVAIWCTNSAKHQNALLTECLPAWGLKLFKCLKWLKVDAMNALPIVEINGDYCKKQPYEMLFIAGHKDCENGNEKQIKEIDLILSVPSIINSHKPPLLPWLRKYLQNKERPNCLELFARYLQPYHTAFGLETLKLMESRFYNKIKRES